MGKTENRTIEEPGGKMEGEKISIEYGKGRCKGRRWESEDVQRTLHSCSNIKTGTEKFMSYKRYYSIHLRTYRTPYLFKAVVRGCRGIRSPTVKTEN
jgi:hypothetical protein